MAGPLADVGLPVELAEGGSLSSGGAAWRREEGGGWKHRQAAVAGEPVCLFGVTW